MKQFMDENFLLDTKTAQDLFHNHAAKMPIIDYHCHLIPEMVANDHKFKSITELWLGGDHYKWRAMRTNGVDERFCTGTDTHVRVLLNLKVKVSYMYLFFSLLFQMVFKIAGDVFVQVYTVTSHHVMSVFRINEEIRMGTSFNTSSQE